MPVNKRVIIIDYSIHILCVWAYSAPIKVDELKREFGVRIYPKRHFITLSGNNEEHGINLSGWC